MKQWREKNPLAGVQKRRRHKACPATCGVKSVCEGEGCVCGWFTSVQCVWCEMCGGSNVNCVCVKCVYAQSSSGKAGMAGVCQIVCGRVKQVCGGKAGQAGLGQEKAGMGARRKGLQVWGQGGVMGGEGAWGQVWEVHHPECTR